MTYIFKLESAGGDILRAVCNLRKRVATISVRGSIEATALVVILWALIRRMKEDGLALRVGGGYYWDSDDSRVTCYVRGKPVGWANIGYGEYEGSLECLMYYALYVMDRIEDSRDIYHLVDVAPLREPTYTFDAINHLHARGACEQGNLLPQFFVSPHADCWPGTITDLLEADDWIDEELDKALFNFTTYARIRDRWQTNTPENDLPDWLISLGTVEVPQEDTSNVFADLDLDEDEDEFEY